LEVGAERELHAQEYICKDRNELRICSGLYIIHVSGSSTYQNKGLKTGIRYKMTFFKLSKTRRPNSIAAGIEEKSLFNRMIEAELYSIIGIEGK